MKIKHYLTPTEVAELLMVSPVTVRQWASKGLIEAQTTPGGHRRFKMGEIERFANERGLKIPVEDESLKVLIVDDDLQLRSFLGEFVSTAIDGVIVKEAKDGFEAGRVVQAFQPNVLLLDLMMPGINGFSICRQLKGDPQTQPLAIIAMTGYFTKENVQRIKAAGAECCLSKPIDTDVLLKMLTGIFSRIKRARAV